MLKQNFTVETERTSSRKAVAAAAAPGATTHARAGAVGHVAASRVAAAGARGRAGSITRAAATRARVEQQRKQEQE